MIRINLLSGERKTAKTKIAFQAGQKITAACTLILVGAGLFIGWRYWSLNRESARLDQEIASAQGETARLQSIISQVQEFEQRRAQLQERVALIEQLRRIKWVQCTCLTRSAARCPRRCAHRFETRRDTQ